MIGNPTYIEARSPKFVNSLKDKLQTEIGKRFDSENAKCFPRGADILVFFYELSFRLLNSNGINFFIAENAWLSTGYGKAFQNYLIKNIGVRAIIDSDYKYFESADINTVITSFSKQKSEKIVFFHCHDDFAHQHCNTTSYKQNGKNIEVLEFDTSSLLLKNYKWGFISSTSLELISLLENINKINDKIFQSKIEIGQGLNLTKDKILTNKSKDSVPFFISENGAEYIWDKTAYFVDKENASKTRRVPLMFLPRGLGTHFCCMNEIQGYTSSYVEIYEKEKLTEIQKLCLWIFCNSSLLWVLREYTGRCNLGGGMLKAEATDLKTLPLCFNFSDVDEMKNIYKLARGKSNSSNIDESIKSEIHQRIDKLVYRYFNLPVENNIFTQMLLERFNWRNKKSKSK